MRSAALLALLSLALVLPARATEAEVEALLERVREGQDRDLARWQQLEFRRDVLRVRLEEDGDIERCEHLVFDIRPEGEGFAETLIALNERKPRAKEVREHAEAGRFEKHWRELRGDAARKDAFSLRQLLEMSHYEDAGTVVIGGLECRRLDFGPAGAGRASDVGRLAGAMEGSLFVSLADGRLRRAEARTVRGVALRGGLARVKELEIEMEQAAVAGDLVLPVRIEVRTTLRVLLGVQRKLNRYHYSDHAVAPDS